MKTKIIFLALAASGILLLSGCDDFLDKPPYTSVVDETYWTDEASVRTYSYGFYASRFAGFGQNDSGGAYSIRQPLNDDYTNSALPGFTVNVPVSDGNWSGPFTRIRQSNVMIQNLPKVSFRDQQTADHWMAFARFFRGYDYATFAFQYGDVPYYDRPLDDGDPELIRPRDPYTFVMDKVLEDFQYASEYLKVSDDRIGPMRQVLFKDFADAMISRRMLWAGTQIKYNPASTADQKERAVVYLEAAKDAAYKVITSGRHSLANNYRQMCSTVDLLAPAKSDVLSEMLMFRVYGTGLITHAIMTTNGVSANQAYSATKDLVDSYLCTNGLPIHPVGGPNGVYAGDKTAMNQFSNRDPRLSATFYTDKFYNQYDNQIYANSGYRSYKFLDEETKSDATATQSFNVTDAPIIRLGEVMMNYIEACAELADMGKYTVTQNDLDITVNKLRKRNGYGAAYRLPDLQVIGGQPAVGGVVYDDADRDADIPAFIWEVRRERRVELVYEGYRQQDLKRWRKIGYCNTETYPRKNLGAYVVKTTASQALVLADIDGRIVSGAGTAGEGYLKPAISERNAANGGVLDRVYLNPIPSKQIDLYKREGVELKQNPGWTENEE